MLLVENNLGWSVVTLTAAILKMKGVSRYSRYEQSLPHQSDFSSLSLEKKIIQHASGKRPYIFMSENVMGSDIDTI